MFELEDNVYIVKGYENACIYDLNTFSLYHINSYLYDWITCLIEEKSENTTEYTPSEKSMLLQLVERKILVDIDVRKPPRKNSKNIPKIEFAWIEVTTKCNLKCIHCYDESSIVCTQKMSLEDYKLVINELKSIGVKKVQLIGGEPFIIGDSLKSMLSLACENFENVEIFTNGTLLNNDWADFIKNNGIKVALSVYSYNAAEHDKITGHIGSHKLTNNAIRLLHAKGIKYRVCNVLMNGLSLGEKNTELYDLSNTKDIVRLAGRADMSLLSKELIRKKLITKESFSYKLNPSLFHKLRTEHNCFGSKLYISADMEVYPCVMERRISHGNLKNSNLNNLLKEFIFLLGKDNINECKDCEYRYACFDCRSNSLSNNIYEKPWYCTYDPYLGEWKDPEQFINNLLCQQS